MSDDSSKELRFLKAYAYGATTLIVLLGVLAFRARQTPRFREIQVQRIDVVEPDGTLRMVLSNHTLFPQPIIGGKAYPLRTGTGGAGAGMIFYNDEGNEDGGLTFTGRRTADGYAAGAGLSLDQYNQDETVTLSYDDRNGRRRAGLTIADRPNGSIQVFADSAMAIRALPDGPEKTRRLAALQTYMRSQGYFGDTPRVYAGKDPDRTALVVLSDPQGRPRLRLAVDSLGAPKLQFLDEAGKVTSELPARR